MPGDLHPQPYSASTKPDLPGGKSAPYCFVTPLFVCGTRGYWSYVLTLHRSGRREHSSPTATHTASRLLGDESRRLGWLAASNATCSSLLVGGTLALLSWVLRSLSDRNGDAPSQLHLRLGRQILGDGGVVLDGAKERRGQR